MKEKSLMRSGRGILIAAIATLAPLGVANAETNLFAIKVSDTTTAPTLDRSQYDKLEFLGNVQWIPKSRGAEGPMRSESDQERMAKYDKLDILGNVFWFPKKDGTQTQ